MQPNKMAKVYKEKAVLVRVFVERPRKRRISSSSSNRHHHCNIKQEVKVLDKHGDADRKGYSRRAELLLYSQRLRQSVRSAKSSPFVPLPISSNNQPTRNIVAPPRKPGDVRRTPTCLGNCKILNPNFWTCLIISPQAKQSKKKKHSAGSTSTSATMRVVLKSLEVQQKKRYILKLLSKLTRKVNIQG